MEVTEGSMTSEVQSWENLYNEYIFSLKSDSVASFDRKLVDMCSNRLKPGKQSTTLVIRGHFSFGTRCDAFAVKDCIVIGRNFCFESISL